MTKEIEELWDKLKDKVSIQERGKIDFFLAIKDKYDESVMWEQLPESGKIEADEVEEKTLDDFGNDEIEAHLLYEWAQSGSDTYGAEMLEFLKDEQGDSADLPTGLAEDEWKKEYLASIWSQYSLAELEAALPDKMTAGAAR